MRIAAAQLNQTVGDFGGNAQRIIAAAREAAAARARVLLTPELSICGYPPEDLLLRDGFQRRCDETLEALMRATAALDLYLIVGHPLREGTARETGANDGPAGDSPAHDGAAQGGPRRYNAATVLHGGRVVAVCRKRELPNYAVFDEQRYFSRGQQACVFEVDGTRFGVAICEDIWFTEPARAARAAGAEALLVLNASPYHRDKQHLRLDTARAHVAGAGLPMLAANLVGGQDELVFDGLSFALDAAGELVAQARAFEPALLLVDETGLAHFGQLRLRLRQMRAQLRLCRAGGAQGLGGFQLQLR